VTKLPSKLPDTREMEWPSLVDTTARAMLEEGVSLLSEDVHPECGDAVPEAARNGERLGHWVDDVAERLGLDTSPSR